MTSWKELKSERKSILSIVELSIILMGLALLSVIFLGYKTLDSSRLIHQAESTLRQAGDQLEEYKLGDPLQTEATFFMLNFKSLSPLPAGSGWETTRKVMNEAQSNMGGLVQSSKNFIELSAKSTSSFETLNKEAKAMIESGKGKETAQDVLLSAQSIRDWMTKAPTDAEMHQIESKYLTEKVKVADAALAAKEKDPAIVGLKKAYDAWMDAINEQLLEEKAFTEQKNLAKHQIAGASLNLESQTASWLRKIRLFSQGFIVIFTLLIAVIFFNLQALKKNPHLNTMFASKSNDVLNAELEAVTAQVDQILANVDKAWMDSKSELKVVHHAIEDSEVLESQVQQLKTDIGGVLGSIAKTLQDLEHVARKSNPADADKIAALIAEAQSSGARIQQSLDVLTESGFSIHDELQQVRKNIKRLMTETLNLKKEGEDLEEASETISSV